MRKKQKGNSIYIMIPTIFFIMVLLFYVNNYMRAADIVSDNLKTSLDAANLATTVINVEKMVHAGSISIIGDIQNTTNLSDYEKYIVKKRFVSFEKTLQSNVGLKDDFTFHGGTCGWAGNQLVAKNENNGNLQKGSLTIDSFIIYDLIDTNVYAYEITNVMNYTETPEIRKTLAGTVEKDANGTVINSTVLTPEGIKVLTPTVFSKISFPIAPPQIVDFEWIDYSSVKSDPKINEYIRGEKRVSRTSTTSIKYN